MSQLQRCVIRDELVEAAKLIQKRYCLRNWGDAINMVFAAHRHAYLDQVQQTGNSQHPQINPHPAPPLLHASSAPASTRNPGTLRGFLKELESQLISESQN